jgi:hypothetical protein
MTTRPGPDDGSAPPTWWASLAVRSAALPLPSEHRYRYRQEFLAELHGMPPSAQLHHAAGVLSRVLTLRVALTDPGRRLTEEGSARSWRCRLGRHGWRYEKDWQGTSYRVCRRCGKVTGVSVVPPGGPQWPMGGGY